MDQTSCEADVKAKAGDRSFCLPTLSRMSYEESCELLTGQSWVMVMKWNVKHPNQTKVRETAWPSLKCYGNILKLGINLRGKILLYSIVPLLYNLRKNSNKHIFVPLIYLVYLRTWHLKELYVTDDRRALQVFIIPNFKTLVTNSIIIVLHCRWP